MCSVSPQRPSSHLQGPCAVGGDMLPTPRDWVGASLSADPALDDFRKVNDKAGRLRGQRRSHLWFRAGEIPVCPDLCVSPPASAVVWTSGVEPTRRPFRPSPGLNLARGPCTHAHAPVPAPFRPSSLRTALCLAALPSRGDHARVSSALRAQTAEEAGAGPEEELGGFGTGSPGVEELRSGVEGGVWTGTALRTHRCGVLGGQSVRRLGCCFRVGRY